MKKPLKLPTFKTGDQERDFWAKIDLADYFERNGLTSATSPISRSLSSTLPTV